jgi:hypothetical protein
MKDLFSVRTAVLTSRGIARGTHLRQQYLRENSAPFTHQQKTYLGVSRESHVCVCLVITERLVAVGVVRTAFL